MKIRIEIDENAEEELLIRCKEITPDILKLQQQLLLQADKSNQFTFYKGDTEFYLDANQILFFETENGGVMAHTITEAYETRMKLYKLEECLPGSFQRISKSAIVNVKKIYAINRNLTASSAISFQRTHKQIYVSRSYYKVLKEKLKEMR